MNIIDKLDAYLLKQETERRDRKAHYPSEITECRRKAFYKWTKTTESDPVEAGALWKMRIGSNMEDLLSKLLDGAGLKVINQIGGEFAWDGLKYPMRYRVDNLFVDEDGETVGIELKTSFGMGIKQIQLEGRPKPEHAAQVWCYMRFADINRFYLIYIGRDNGYRTQFVMDFRNGHFCANGTPIEINENDMILRLADIEKAVEENKIPGRDFNAIIKEGQIRDDVQKNKVKYKSDWQCCYCAWARLCWKEEMEKYQTGDNITEKKEA